MQINLIRQAPIPRSSQSQISTPFILTHHPKNKDIKQQQF
jgi:hypothetical protein